jgi:hypothetical protein
MIAELTGLLLASPTVIAAVSSMKEIITVCVIFISHLPDARTAMA